MTSSEDCAKRAAGKAAAALIQNDMRIGLGTGSTSSYFIESLIERVQSGLRIAAVATSLRSEQKARAGGIPFLNINEVTSLDVTVDGADEIDHKKRMIKGGGGALLREKIVASMSREMIVIVDEKKVVDHLGSFPLPIEIVSFAYKATLSKIQDRGYSAKLRLNTEGGFYVTDNGNYIVDIKFAELLKNPEEQEAILRAIPGVVETGFFFNLAKKVIVGYADGTVKIQ